MVMLLLTKSPEVILTKISLDNVKFAADVRAIERCYGKVLKAFNLKYDLDCNLSGFTVRAMGRVIDVDVTRTGVGYTLRFQQLEYTPEYAGTDATLWNRVR